MKRIALQLPYLVIQLVLNSVTVHVFLYHSILGTFSLQHKQQSFS